jgi:ubiquinone/menaquinone biosynthesis C-methylase UbiE
LLQGHNQPAPEIVAHYNEGREPHRLASGAGQLEYVRTQELLLRFLPPPPAVLLDIGGGAGVYSFWLASLGYAVHLVDAMPLHIEQARQVASHPEISPLASLYVEDARRVDFEKASRDAVLLMGPLYHLIEREDRLLALQEASRVLRPGGVVCAVGISRFASTLDGLLGGLLHDPEFESIVVQDLATGQHRNPHNRPRYFTTAFFHHPDELRAEVIEAGFSEVEGLGIEGPAAMMPNFAEFWDNAEKRERLLRTVRAVETEPSLMGVSAHLLAVGQKPR